MPIAIPVCHQPALLESGLPPGPPCQADLDGSYGRWRVGRWSARLARVDGRRDGLLSSCCDAKLERYRAALDAGADPAVVTGWIAQTQTERARAEADLDANAGNSPRRMSRAEIRGLVTALGDIAAALRDADPADKAEVYHQLGLRLTYQPETQTVRASVDLSAHRGVMVCVRGVTRTVAPPPMTIGKTLALTQL